MEYTLDRIRPDDRRLQAVLDRLLQAEGIHRDANLDYTVGLFDQEFRLVATGSCFANTLRCLAVDRSHQGEGLLAQVVTHLQQYQIEHGHTHQFLYTKCDTAAFFSDLGFHEIARVENRLVFMENRRNGFRHFLDELQKHARAGNSAALVMNCNPFTLGHRYLVEQAAAQSDTVHLFVVSEDASLFPFAHRYRLVQEGCADLPDVVLHQTGSYMISSAVFPSYFLEDSETAIAMQARLDLILFKKIADALGIGKRYVGEEPFSKVTGIYNRIMLEQLPAQGIECVVIPRKALGDVPISASRVRQLIHDGRMEEIRPMVPQSTYDYFLTPEGRETVRRIQAEESVIHY